MEQNSCSLVLRLFGPQLDQVTQVLRTAAGQGCPGLNLLMKNGEYAVCVTARGGDAAAVCRRWQDYFESRFGDAVFCVGEESLANVAVDALAKSGRLFVAADAATGKLLDAALAGCDKAGSVYDFGAQSYAHPKRGGRVVPNKHLLKKYPHCPVQPAATRAHAALRVSGADWAAAYCPSDGQHPAFVLTCNDKYAWVRPLPADGDEQALAAGWLLDMLRRMAQGKDMDSFVERFKLGGPAPKLELPGQALAGLASAPAPKAAAPAAPAPAAAKAAPAPAAPEAPKAEAAQPPQAPAQPAPKAAPAQSAPAPAAPAFTGKAPRPDGAPADLLKPDEQLTSAAQLLFSDEAPEPAHEGQEQKPSGPHWGRLIGCVLLVAAIAGGVALWLWQGGKLPGGGSVLGDVGYGTADYDDAARDYLLAQQAKDAGVAAYLALPELDGSLVWSAGAAAPGGRQGGVVNAAEDALPRFTGSETLGQSQSNVLVRCPAASMEQLSELVQEEVLKENSGFTLYTASGDYRYKVLAVYEWDPAETGESAFDLYGLQDLSNYEDYLTFVLGAKARSLYEMPANVQDGDAFVTLVADSPSASGRMLAITGRQLRENEAAILFGNQVQPAEQPLMPMAVYESEGVSAPSLTTLSQYWLNWYKTGGATSSDVQEEAGMPDEDRPLSEVGGGETVEPGASPTPDASASPSASPDASASPKPSATPSASTPATAAPTPGPTPAPTPEPTPTPTPSSGSTITVTMNGVRQEMDLVECLAMIARNEMGANAPVEAYKAQMVAAHSWILSQGGAPSVAGLEPNETIRAAAREVAGQILTYNGSVAFTPYFASAAFGTNSSQEVWGGARPYLINVESPYDKDYASNWQSTRVYYTSEVAARAQERLGVDLYAYSSNPEDWFGDIVKNSSGYVTSIRVGTATTTGRNLRENVRNNVNGKTLRSAAFDISYDAGSEAFTFTVYGYGHGCGMSQMGAWGYAANGWGYADILAHYYPGTTLVTQ